MPTLNEILDNDLGLGTEKTASAKQPKTDIEKLAMDLGLIDENDETEAASQDNIGLNKEARMSMDSIYESLFPGDADIVGTQEKVAAEESEKESDEAKEKEEEDEEKEESEEEKTAALREEAIGERAFDYFHQYVDAHITKIAGEVALQLDQTIPGKVEDNEDESEGAMDTDGDEGAEGEKAMAMAQSVGQESKKDSPDGELKTAAIKKHFLKLMVEG